MTKQINYDVIIVGGSYAGLAAAMAFGRAMRKVLVIDDGKPCNRQTPHSHNFLTNDGKTPAELLAVAKLQLERYETIQIMNGLAIQGSKIVNGFQIETDRGERFAAVKLIFATGIKDLFPTIEGLAACWGISVIHCPYCHGYEVRHEKTGILGNGDMAFDFSALISNWTKDITLFTNGPATFSVGQQERLKQHNIPVIEKEIAVLEHHDGILSRIIFKDGSTFTLMVLYAPGPFEQHCKIPEALGCAITAEGYIQIDPTQETTVPGIYAIGDNAAKMRTVANAVAMGTSAGIMISKKMIQEEF